MITKGLDFENVTLVGIMDADGMLGFPDFRAHERAFQLMEQVAGRAGRRAKRGNVIIQTRQPGHPIIQQLLHHNYVGMYQDEILQRKELKFPPECKLIELLLSHKDASVLEGCSGIFAEMLRVKLGGRVMGPEFPIIPRVRNLYRKKIMIRIELSDSASSIKKEIITEIRTFQKDPTYRQLLIHIDVDPS